MATENPVFQVLVTEGNQALLAQNQTLDDLAPGQLGIFDSNTNISVDAATTVKPREVYLALGVDRDGDSTVEDILKSAGQVIQIKHIKNFNLKCYTQALPKIVEITGFTAKCETEYGLKLEVRNQLGYLTNGYNQVAKTFVIKTSCCEQEDCVSCPQGDCNEIAIKLAAAINTDQDKVFKAELIDGPGGAVVTDPDSFGTSILTLGSITGGSGYTNGSYTNVALTGGSGTGATANITIAGGAVTAVTIVNGGSGYEVGDTVSATAGLGAGTGFSVGVTAINADACMGVRITTIPLGIRKFCAVNLGYFNPRGTDVIVSGVTGFECNGNITTTQELRFEEGLGYDIAQLEYEAGGWNGKPGPYRTSSIAGVPTNSFESFVDQSAKYTQVALTYDQFSVGGWLEYLNNLMTIVAIPCADSTTLTSLTTIMNSILQAHGFKSLIASAGECDCTGEEGTSDKVPAENGLA